MLTHLFRSEPSTPSAQTHPASEELDLKKIPRHVAMIMDGNGRWAKRQGKPRTFGHTYGAKALREIVRYADSIGIEALTAYAFSTENWKRPVTEVSFIMKLLVEYLTNELEEFKKYQVRMRFIGSRKELPDLVLKKMEEAEQETKDNQGILLTIAINYGGQAEILHAATEIARQVKAGTLQPDDITKALFEDHLYTRGIPAPDLFDPHGR